MAEKNLFKVVAQLLGESVEEIKKAKIGVEDRLQYAEKDFFENNTRSNLITDNTTCHEVKFTKMTHIKLEL